MKKAVMWGQQCLLDRGCLPSPVLLLPYVASTHTTKDIKCNIYPNVMESNKTETLSKENLDSLEQDLLLHISLATSIPNQASCHMSPIPTPLLAVATAAVVALK